MRMAQLLSYSLAMIAAMDERHGPTSYRRSYRRPSVNRGGVRIYDPATYRRGDVGWDVVKAEAFQAARRDRKRRQWILQGKRYGLKAPR